MSNLKNLDLKGNKAVTRVKDRIAQIDHQLQELRKEMHQSKPKIKAKNTKNVEKKKMPNRTPVRINETVSLVGQMQI